MKPDQSRKRQKSVIFVALLMFSFVLVLLQLWLFAAGLEQVIAGRTESLTAGALISTVIFAVNWWMLRGVLAIDRRR